MKRCWIIAVVLIAVAGCKPEPAATPQSPADRYAVFQQKMGGLQRQLQQRDARIKEMQQHAGRLSSRLRQSESTNKQLRLQLETVGDSPLQRNRYQKLSRQRALEIQRLQVRVRALLGRLQQAGQATTQPATQPADTAGSVP